LKSLSYFLGWEGEHWAGKPEDLPMMLWMEMPLPHPGGFIRLNGVFLSAMGIGVI
jgi:hypothetical protein